MNEVSLSNDLNVITAEINSYKQVAGQAIFEIGRRLKHVKENDLAYGEFGDWLESIELNHRIANQMMKVAAELPDSRTSSNLGLEALYQIATMPKQDQEKEHEIPSTGETKKPDDMTVKELREVKKRNKELEQAKQQAERQAEQLRESNKITMNKLEQAENQKPEVKEITKEVVPADLQHELDSTKRIADFTSKENEALRKELDSYKMKDASDFDEETASYELKKMQYEADRNTTEIRTAFKRLNDKVSVSKYMYDAISAGSDYEKKRMREEIDITKSVISSIEASLNNRREIN